MHSLSISVQLVPIMSFFVFDFAVPPGSGARGERGFDGGGGERGRFQHRVVPQVKSVPQI
eukprot:3227865-Rhodomonas_salina.1